MLHGRTDNQDMWVLAKGGDERWYPIELKWFDLASPREAKSINQRPYHQYVVYRAGRRCSRVVHPTEATIVTIRQSKVSAYIRSQSSERDCHDTISQIRHANRVKDTHPFCTLQLEFHCSQTSRTSSLEEEGYPDGSTTGTA